MATGVCEDIREHLRRTAEEVSAALASRLAGLHGPSPRLIEAMRYSLTGSGKRLRPALVLWCAELCGGRREQAMPAALAIECVHTFSLVHDDLPSLDDDDLRRGRPTVHRQFDEPTAILAGDALLALAFEILAGEVGDPQPAARLAAELAAAAGCRGMIGGEAADLEGQAATPDARRVEAIHAAKTARLVQAACRMGAISAGADETRLAALGDYGHALGMAFQAADDLLDVTGRSEVVGKRTGKDHASGKQTYPRAVGIDAARRIAEAAAAAAQAALVPLGDATAHLAALARYVVERES